MVPARGEAFVLDAQLLGALLREQIERDVVKNGEVLWGVAGVRMRVWSWRRATSKTQWRLFSIAQ